MTKNRTSLWWPSCYSENTRKKKRSKKEEKEEKEKKRRKRKRKKRKEKKDKLGRKIRAECGELRLGN